MARICYIQTCVNLYVSDMRDQDLLQSLDL